MSHEIERPILHDFDYAELDRREKLRGHKRPSGFRCPRCSAETTVVDSRSIDNGVRRRRACPSCRFRVTTYERVGDGALPDDAAVLRMARRLVMRLLAHIPRDDLLTPSSSPSIVVEATPVPPAEDTTSSEGSE